MDAGPESATARASAVQQNVPEAGQEVRGEPVADYQVAVTVPVLDAFNELSFSNLQEKTFLASK
jgi:hypothetical protein